VDLREGRGPSRRYPQREAQKKKGRRARAWFAAQSSGGFFASTFAPQVPGSNGQGVGGGAPTYGPPATNAPPPPQVTPDAPPPVNSFDPSGTFRAPDGRWLMSQR
jgi:hypothetical protein